jgi:hypothetical protein
LMRTLPLRVNKLDHSCAPLTSFVREPISARVAEHEVNSKSKLPGNEERKTRDGVNINSDSKESSSQVVSLTRGVEAVKSLVEDAHAEQSQIRIPAQDMSRFDITPDTILHIILVNFLCRIGISN